MEENRKPADHPDRRLKLLTADHPPPRQSHQPPPQPLQNCPRCDSTNTKFCYYNNYSLSQPRYFCKTCRRYWTQGGTLRNVPVGGGCRKGKRAKTSGATTTSASSNDLDTQRLLAPLTLPPPPVSSSPQLMGTMTSLGRKEMGNNVNLSPMNPYYQNGGFFPSFAAMRSPNLGHPQPLINHHQQQQQQHNFGGQFGIGASSNSNNSSNSNMALLQGFSNNSLVPMPGHQQQHDQQIFNASDPTGDKMMNTIEPPYYLSAPNGPLIFGPSWNQNQLNNNAPSSSNNSANAMNPNHQWPGFGPPP